MKPGVKQNNVQTSHTYDVSEIIFGRNEILERLALYALHKQADRRTVDKFLGFAPRLSLRKAVEFYINSRLFHLISQRLISRKSPAMI